MTRLLLAILVFLNSVSVFGATTSEPRSCDEVVVASDSGEGRVFEAEDLDHNLIMINAQVTDSDSSTHQYWVVTLAGEPVPFGFYESSLFLTTGSTGPHIDPGEVRTGFDLVLCPSLISDGRILLSVRGTLDDAWQSIEGDQSLVRFAQTYLADDHQPVRVLDGTTYGSAGAPRAMQKLTLTAWLVGRTGHERDNP